MRPCLGKRRGVVEGAHHPEGAPVAGRLFIERPPARRHRRNSAMLRPLDSDGPRVGTIVKRPLLFASALAASLAAAGLARAEGDAPRIEWRDCPWTLAQP